jgi:hypothetical protein
MFGENVRKTQGIGLCSRDPVLVTGLQVGEEQRDGREAQKRAERRNGRCRRPRYPSKGSRHGLPDLPMKCRPKVTLQS